MDSGGIIEIKEGCVDWSTYQDREMDDDGDDFFGEEYVKIDNLFVKKEYRGQGWGRKLLERAIELIKKQYPTHSIKIVPEPKDKDTDQEKLAAFYYSFPELEVVFF